MKNFISKFNDIPKIKRRLFAFCIAISFAILFLVCYFWFQNLGGLETLNSSKLLIENWFFIFPFIGGTFSFFCVIIFLFWIFKKLKEDSGLIHTSIWGYSLGLIIAGVLLSNIFSPNVALNFGCAMGALVSASLIPGIAAELK